MSEYALLMRGYRLITAEILYHLPDYPDLLQSFVWQQLDLAPKYPVLTKFLDYWERNIEGRLHSVRVAATGILGARDYTYAKGEFSLH